MALDKMQQQAVEHKDGPMMVLAGPGSGKTTVITHRVKHMIEQHKINPANILVITFTKAAATEMKLRFQALMSKSEMHNDAMAGMANTFGNYPVTFGTFHAVFFMIIKHAYGYKASDIVQEETRYQAMKQIAAHMQVQFEDEADFISSVLAEISMVKNSGIKLEHYYSTNCGDEVFRKLFDGYQHFLRNHRLIDFDDMLTFTKELFEQRPDILTGWQKRYPYILIDEFQDINQIQYEVVRMLSKTTENLFIVGDDDQSIYRFRGARPEIMLHVEKDFPKIQKVILSMNYRCPRKIVEQAQHLIGHNQVRFAKDIHAASDLAGQINHYAFAHQKDQNQYLVEDIRKKHSQGVPYDDMVLLYRTNIQPRLLMEFLMRYNIPFRTRERIPNIYDHWIVKDLLCYIRIALGSDKRADFLQIMNRPKRYLSRDSLSYENVAWDVWEEYYKSADWMIERLNKFRKDLKVIAGLRPYSAIMYIRKSVDYESYLKEICEIRRMDYEELEGILDEVMASAKNFTTFQAWFLHMDDVREQLVNQESHGREVDGKKIDAVTLSTFHGVKGLEYDHVYITDINEGFLPYRKSVLDADIEEERRLFYVGMTRAKKELTLCHCGQIQNKEVMASRFLSELF